MNKRFSKFMLTSASALALLAAYPSVASTAEVVGFDLPAITAQAATQGDAFIRVVRALPSVSNIKASDASSVRAARNLYNSLPNAEKANADVTRWAGYLADKEAALPVDHVRDFLLESRVLPNVAEINAMNAKEFAQAKVDLQAARSSYAKLTNAEKANTEVARWAGYLTVKEDAFGVTFILAAKDLPSMDAIGKMDAKELVAVQEDIDSVRELYDALSDVAKADKEVARWIGYVDQKEEAVEAAAVVAIDSVKAINAKTIEVTFNKAVEDTAATVEVVRGNFKQNVTVNWAADRKSVQLVGANNFQPATYSVTVKGKDLELTSAVAIEAQKVVSIEILDEVAVVNKSVKDGVLPAGTTATVGYVVRDQYGVDITKSTNLADIKSNSTDILVSPATGVITLQSNVVANKKLGDLVPVVLFDAKTGVSTTKTVSLSSKSAVSSIAVKGLYNAKGEVVSLNDQSKANEAFIVLDLKDQYGNAITNKDDASGLVITNTNPSIFTLVDGSSAKPVVQTIGKDKELVIKFESIIKAGNADVLVISTTNGRSINYNVNVAETTTSDAIYASQPEIAVAGQPTSIPLSVTDKQGNAILDKKLLSTAGKGIKVDNVLVREDQLEVKDGQLFFKKTFDSKGPKALVFTSSTYKVSTITVDVKEKAVPTIVRGLRNPLVLSIAQTSKQGQLITAKDHLVIEDQYGREIKGSDAGIVVLLVGEPEVVSVVGNRVKAEKNGTATLSIKLATENDNIDSTVEVQVRATDGTQYSGYELPAISKTKAGEPKKFTVNGILNGGKVALQPSEFTAKVTGGQGSVTTNGNEITVPVGALNTKDNKPVDTEFTLTVTVNASGEVLTQKFVVSNEGRTVQDFFFTDKAVSTTHDNAKAVTETEVKSSATTLDVRAATTDQYGQNLVSVLAPSKVTVVPAVVGQVEITGNGTPAPVVTLAAGVEEAKVTYNVTIGNATKALTVTVVKATGTPDKEDPVVEEDPVVAAKAKFLAALESEAGKITAEDVEITTAGENIGITVDYKDTDGLKTTANKAMGELLELLGIETNDLTNIKIDGTTYNTRKDLENYLVGQRLGGRTDPFAYEVEVEVDGVPFDLNGYISITFKQVGAHAE